MTPKNHGEFSIINVLTSLWFPQVPLAMTVNMTTSAPASSLAENVDDQHEFPGLYGRQVKVDLLVTYMHTLWRLMYLSHGEESLPVS